MVAIIILAIIICFMIFLLFRLFLARLPKVSGALVQTDINKARAINNLSAAIKIPSVSAPDGITKGYAFKAFHKFLKESYPKVHNFFTLEVINEYSLLYSCECDSNLLPIMLMAHMDVVPASEEKDSGWKFPPFSGEISQGYIHGRGALDMKGQLVAIFEALETLLEQDFIPQRGIYIALGHDEETMETGNRRIAEICVQRGLRFEYIFDEGGTFIDASHIGVKQPLALLGICEKGYADMELIARGAGGHASIPVSNSAWQRISHALLAIEKNNMPIKLTPPIREMIIKSASKMRFIYRVMAVNLWLFAPVFKRLFLKKPFTKALVQSTIVPTVGSGGDQANVLPQSVFINLNIRVLPGDHESDVLNHLKRHCPDMEIKVKRYNNASNIADRRYAKIFGIIRGSFPGHAVAPYVMTGATDSRHFKDVCDCILLFNPFPCLLDDAHTIHGINERMEEDSLITGVKYFITLIQEFTSVN